MLTILYISAFLLAIFSLVLIHEFGHFLVARIFKVKIERFSIGFGKPFYKWKHKKGSTEYVIAPILLGGYVKFLDTRETKVVADSDRHFAFDHKPILERLAIIAAGPVANIIFALFAFWLMLVIGFKLPKPIIGKVLHNSIASRVDMRAGEEIVKIDQINTRNWEEVIVAMVARVGDAGNLSITTQSLPLLPAQTYQLDLANWRIDSYDPNPLLDFGLVGYEPRVLPIISNVTRDSPAAKSGLRINDRIVAVEGQPVNDWKDFIELIKKYPEKQTKLSLERDGKAINLTVTTGSKFGAGWKKIGFLGVSSLSVEWPEQMLRKYQYTMWQACGEAWHKMQLFVGLNNIILTKLFIGKISFHILGGPIAIFTASGQALDQGFIMFLDFLAVLSLSLALVNLLPLPGLDGGYVVLLFIEAIMRRPISMRVQTLLLRLGIIFFIVLILQVTINDLKRLF
ncbi:Regulator of sigma E protease [Gammaproteobacteria bacterium]